jgi:hypothetical protein
MAMNRDEFILSNDILLRPFLSTEMEEAAELCLEDLFGQHIIAQIKKVLSSRLTLKPEERIEIQSASQEHILEKIRQLRDCLNEEEITTTPICELLAYVSQVVFNACKDFFERQRPEWRRAKNRLNRLRDETGTGLIFFANEEGQRLVRFQGKPENRAKNTVEEFVAEVHQRHSNSMFLKVQEIVPIICRLADGALTENEVIRAVLEITNPTFFEKTKMSPNLASTLNQIDNAHLVAERQREFLSVVWEALNEIPSHQRKALLLNMKEAVGVEAISLFLRLKIAAMEEIAKTLELSLEEFSDAFDRFPLSSAEIADVLGIRDKGKTSKEQRVDSLRRIARDLLRRRLGLK